MNQPSIYMLGRYTSHPVTHMEKYWESIRYPLLIQPTEIHRVFFSHLGSPCCYGHGRERAKFSIQIAGGGGVSKTSIKKCYVHLTLWKNQYLLRRYFGPPQKGTLSVHFLAADPWIHRVIHFPYKSTISTRSIHHSRGSVI